MPMESQNEQISSLIELNEALENYFANTIIPQLFVDAHLILRKFSPPAMKQFNLKDEYVGKPLNEIRENFRFPTIIDNIKQVIASGEILEKEIQTTDMGWYQMNIIPYLVRKENKTNGVIITFIDITSRIKDLRDHEKLIAEHELLLDTIAHDIKNPLMALGMTIELLKKVPEKGMDKFPVLLEHVENSLIKMKNIIYDLVEQRWHKHRYQAVEELLDLQNILEDVRLTLAPQIQESKAIINYELGISEISFVRRKLRSVMYNLISNAIKYRSADRIPHIRISSYQENEYIVISVADNGIGIRKEDHAHIFEKYGRAETTAEGHGVGLYLVKEIVTRAGGKITVTSEPGKGSEFQVYLALAQTTPRK